MRVVVDDQSPRLTSAELLETAASAGERADCSGGFARFDTGQKRGFERRDRICSVVRAGNVERHMFAAPLKGRPARAQLQRINTERDHRLIATEFEQFIEIGDNGLFGLNQETAKHLT